MRRGMMQSSFNPSYPNTFIGGVGSGYITNKADLIAHSNLLDKDIYLFEKDAYNNISFYTNKSFSLNNMSTVIEDDFITYLFDVDGHINQVTDVAFIRTAGSNKFRISYTPNAGITTNGNPRTFYRNLNLKEIVITTLGLSTASSELTATGQNVGGVNVYCNLSEKTSNGGNPDAGLQLANVNPFYRINKMPPSKVIDLTINYITTSSFRLNFTMPTSTNALYKYEVWDKNRFLGWINNIGDVFLGLTSETDYEIKIVTVDQYYNRSEFSNTVNVTTL